MYTLALDTATECVSLAILRDQDIIAEVTRPMDRGQGEALIPMIADLLLQNRLTPADIGQIVVSVGPGSFTGVRIGLATARGMGLALNRPVIGTTTLQALVMRTNDTRMAVLDTKRGDFYTQIFQNARPIETPRIRTADEIRQTGLPISGNPALADIIGSEHFIPAAVSPAVGAALGAAENPLPPEPVYLRGADVSC